MPPSRAFAAGPEESPLRLDVVLLDVPAPPELKNRLASWFPPEAKLNLSSLAQPQSEVATATDPRSVRVTVALASTEEATIVFGFSGPALDVNRRRVRKVRLERGLDELGQERVAQVIHSGVVALIEGRGSDVGDEVLWPTAGPLISERPGHAPMPMLAEPLPEPDRQSEASLARRTAAGTVALELVSFEWNRRAEPLPLLSRLLSSLTGWIGFGGSVTWRGVEGAGLGPQLILGLRCLPARGVSSGLTLDGRLFVPSVADMRDVRIESSGGRLRLATFIESSIGAGWSLAGDLGVGVDINHYSPLSSSDLTLRTTSSATEFQPYFAPQIRFWIGAPLSLGIGAHLDVLPRNGGYFTSTSEGIQSFVGRPWSVQPGLSIAMRWSGHTHVTR